MPYRNAPYYVLAVIAVIVAGFWPSYFAEWGSVPVAVPRPRRRRQHLGDDGRWRKAGPCITGQLPLHRAVGKSSLLLFPFLIGGLAAIIDLTGKGLSPATDRVAADVRRHSS